MLALVVGGGAHLTDSLARWRGIGPPQEAAPVASATPGPAGAFALPELLSQTGLFAAGNPEQVSPDAMFYVPQYPLWSDGATKRRWVAIPKGTQIDASDPDAWRFPTGTRFWKEFSFGERVETRYMELLPDGSYRYATYVWDGGLKDAVIAPETGIRNAHAITGGVSHDVPALADCRACHEGRGTPVLGFGTLQLSPDRDPSAVHAEPVPVDAVDLEALVSRGLVRNLPAALLANPPRIHAATPLERAAAGYLFGNCSGCHNSRGSLAQLGLDFDQPVESGTDAPQARLSTFGRPSQYRLPGVASPLRVTPGAAEQSAVWFRLSSRLALHQMPPLGTKIVDREGLVLVERWINSASFETKTTTTTN